MKQDDQIAKVLEKLDNLTFEVKALRSEIKTISSESMRLNISLNIARDTIKASQTDIDDIKTIVRKFEKKVA